MKQPPPNWRRPLRAGTPTCSRCQRIGPPTYETCLPACNTSHVVAPRNRLSWVSERRKDSQRAAQSPYNGGDPGVVHPPKQTQRAVPAAHANARQREGIALIVEKARLERERRAVPGVACTSPSRFRRGAKGVRIETRTPHLLLLEDLRAHGDLVTHCRWIQG